MISRTKIFSAPFALLAVAAVVAAGDKALREELDRLAFPEANRIYNPAPERGVGSLTA